MIRLEQYCLDRAAFESNMVLLTLHLVDSTMYRCCSDLYVNIKDK